MIGGNRPMDASDPPTTLGPKVAPPPPPPPAPAPAPLYGNPEIIRHPDGKLETAIKGRGWLDYGLVRR
ncbi:MAG: hypothetical protein RL030_1751 [Pseudomonadota bacterium]|jgi:hypothetical protein